MRILSGSHALPFRRYHTIVSMVLQPPLRRRLRRNKMLECASNLCAVKPPPVDPGSSTAAAPLPSDPVSLDRLQVKSLVPLLALAGIAQAVRDGDVRTYSQELEKQECDLMAAGTYLVVEKLRLLAYRNLCRRVHSHLAREHDQGSRTRLLSHGKMVLIRTRPSASWPA